MTTPVDNSPALASRRRRVPVQWFSDTDTSRPGSRANDVPGLADQKDTDRLMNMMTARAAGGKP